MVPYYEKGGFTPFTRHRRFQLTQSASGLIRSERIVGVASVSLSTLADYDSKCFPNRREQFLVEWTTQCNAVSLAFLIDGQLLGFGHASLPDRMEDWAVVCGLD